MKRLILLIVIVIFFLNIDTSYSIITSESKTNSASIATRENFYVANACTNTRMHSKDFNEVIAENISDIGWVGREPLKLDIPNITGVKVSYFWDSYLYLITILQRETKNISGIEYVEFTYHFLILNYSEPQINLSIVQPRGILYLTNYSMLIFANESPDIVDFDVEVLSNKTIYLAYGIQIFDGYDLQAWFYLVKNQLGSWVNVSGPWIYDVDGENYYAHEVKLSRTVVDGDEGLLLVFTYSRSYVAIPGWSLYVTYSVLKAWYSIRNLTSTTSITVGGPKEQMDINSLGEIVFYNNTAYVFLCAEEIGSKVNYVRTYILNVTDNVSEIGHIDLWNSSQLAQTLGYSPKFIDVEATYIGKNDIWDTFLVMWGTYSDIEERVFIGLLLVSIEHHMYNVSQPIGLDTVSSLSKLDPILSSTENESVFICLESKAGIKEPRLYIVSYNISANFTSFQWTTSYRSAFVCENRYTSMDVDATTTYQSRDLIQPNYSDTLIVQVSKTDDGSYAYYSILYHDIDMDYIGDYEEDYYRTNKTLFDTDGDGICDGSEIFIYGTDASNNDTDGDFLGDKFEIELRPNTYYEEYGVYNTYITDPTKRDTDEDEISDYWEITGDYTIEGRMGYPTDPTRIDTDGDGLNDTVEVVLGVKYWINTTTKYFICHPNATLVDTDNDNLSDYREMELMLDPCNPDTDSDGVFDRMEIEVLMTDPHISDSDTDGLSDGLEVLIRTDPLLVDTDRDGLNDSVEYSFDKYWNTTFGWDPMSRLYFDTDGDGLSDWIESIQSTDILSNDTDHDNLSDYAEVVVIGSDPLDSDSDNDGLSDGFEVELGTDPLRRDTDEDFLNDSYEYLVGLNPLSSDTDGDGLLDGEELTRYYTNPLSNDTDEDNISDYAEIIVYNTDPRSNDTDNDGLDDCYEILNGLNPRSNDTDADGLDDYSELQKYNTDPTDSDSDNDGLSDGDEVRIYNTDPTSSDTDNDGISDFNELRATHSNPCEWDTDGDLMGDNIDPLPTFNNFIILAVILSVSGIYWAYSYGLFRNWRKEIIAVGLTDIGGVPLFVLPLGFESEHNIELISSGLLGVHTISGEISGKTIRTLVLEGPLPTIVRRTETSILWVFLKKIYPRLIKNIEKIHNALEDNFGSDIASWSGVPEDVLYIKEWLAKKLGFKYTAGEEIAREFEETFKE